MINTPWLNHKTTLVGYGLALLLLLTVALSACSKGGEKSGPGGADKKKKPPVPVLTAKVRAADVPVELRAIGAVESVHSAPVRAQVGGLLAEILFQEGALVQAGQPLFVIDQAPLKASKRQLQANLARDQAQIKSAEAGSRNAEAQLQNALAMAKRYDELVRQDFVTREQYEQRQTNLTAAQAALDASQAAAQAARATAAATQAALEGLDLQLAYTEIKAPISGQTGSLLAKKGDLIKANDSTPLVIINQLAPILVRFSASEADLAAIQSSRQQGALRVMVPPPGGGEAREGRLVFVDNAVDPTTATIALKAELPNLDHALWPGQFVETTLTLRTIKAALVVPSAAVLAGQQGPYTYVVDGEGKVEVRLLSTGIAAGEETVITAGLSGAETVVTDGQLRLSPGAKVIEKEGLTAASGEKKSAPPDQNTKPTAPEKTP